MLSPEEITHLNNICEYISNDKFECAELELRKVLRSQEYSEPAVSYAYFLLGDIYTNYKNPKRDRKVANQMFLNCINSNTPYPIAFVNFADNESDKSVALNYLKLGLRKFPNSPLIYMRLLRYSEEKDLIKYIAEIESKNIDNTDLLQCVVSILLRQGGFKQAEHFLTKLLSNKDIDDYTAQYYSLLNSFSLAAQDKKLEDVRGVFFEIVKKDVTKQLKQAPHMGYLWCCYKLNNTQDIEAFIEEISFSHGLQDLNDGPWFPILVEFEKIYNLIFEGIGNIIKNNRKVKLYWEALEAFYLYSSFEEYELVRFSKKHLTALKRYLKTDLTNVHVACAIFNMQKHYNMFFDAYKTYVAMNNGYMDLSGKHIDGIDFLAECTPDVVESIYQDVFQSFLDDSVSNKGAFTSGVFDYLVKCLYESKSNNRYIKITQLADKLDKYYLIKSECLFEIAYSYAQLNDISDKAEYYYLQVLEKEYKNSPVLNNLGVICEHRKEYQKAYEYFQKAHEIDGQKELYKNNLNRLEKLIQANKKIIQSLEKEDAWFLERLIKVVNTIDAKGYFICTYKARSELLVVSPQKANDLFDKMLKIGYIEKADSGNHASPSKYTINAFVKEYLKNEIERIEENKQYEELSEKLNVDSLVSLGYTKDLQQLIENTKTPSLKKILNRDIRECAISLVIEQYKSCVILCGSIIEAVLVDIIERNGLLKYDIGTLLNKKQYSKKVNEMDLNELLEIAKHEKLLNLEEYHLSHYLRYYRNIIHPSCEVRKEYEIDMNQAQLMWNAMLLIIKKVFIKNKE